MEKYENKTKDEFTGKFRAKKLSEILGDVIIRLREIKKLRKEILKYQRSHLLVEKKPTLVMTKRQRQKEKTLLRKNENKIKNNFQK